MADETVDEIMARCPLKQEIRDSLWVRFARFVAKGRRLKSYLTLYSPPMMDIKHLRDRQLIEFDGEKFRGVVAVTYHPGHYADAMSSSSGRPELMLCGDIDRLITDRSRNPDRLRFNDQFPIQVANFDYCNSLFDKDNTLPLSDHLRALDAFVGKQEDSQAKEFVLFLTTRSELRDPAGPNQFHPVFVDDLVSRIDDNRQHNTKFAAKYDAVFPGLDGRALRRERYGQFIPIGLSKLVAQVFAHHNFEVLKTEGCMLVRDRKKTPESWVLHLAFHAKAVKQTLATFGRLPPFHFERRLAGFVEIVGRNEMRWLRETSNHDDLQRKHGPDIARLASQTLDLPVPEPESREG